MSIDYIVENSKEGIPTLAVISNGKTIRIHSSMYPSKEADVNIELSGLPNKYDCLIVLGTGFAYHLLSLKSQVDAYKKIICVDILSGLKKHIADNPLTSFLTKNSNIIFLCGYSNAQLKEVLKNEIDFSIIKGIKVINHAASFRAFDEYYSDTVKVINEIIDAKASNAAALNKFAVRYIRNSLNNLKHFSNFHKVSDLKNKFLGYSAIIVSSGPSLNHHLKNIALYKDRFLIIAVDSAVPVLQSMKINADFIVGIDPQVYVREHLYNIDLTKSILVTSFSAYTNHLLCSSKIYLSLNTHPLSQITEHLFPNTIGSIDSKTGSVVGDAINLAHYMGAKFIGIVGLDFSFEKFDIYARGTAYQRRFAELYQNRILPVETQNLNYIMKNSGKFKLSNRFTRKSFIAYKDAIEYFIESNKSNNIECFNIVSAGLPIKGTKEIEFSDFVKLCGKQKDIQELTRIEKKDKRDKKYEKDEKETENNLENSVKKILQTNVLNEAADMCVENKLIKQKIVKLLKKYSC